MKTPANNETRPAAPPDAEAGVLRVFQSREQTRAFYNKISRVYDLLSEKSESPLRRAGLELLKPAPGEKVLEIGFGTGHSLVALARAVGPKGAVCGLDLSDKMLLEAARNLAAAGLRDRVTLRRGDACQMPWQNAGMDAIFMSFTLELFDTPEIGKVLRECVRVLRPGGRIAVVGMSRLGPGDPLRRLYEWTHKHFPNFVDCRPIYVEAALKDAGLTIQKSLLKHLWVPVEIVLAVHQPPSAPPVP